jgi:hypothetical protein
MKKILRKHPLSPSAGSRRPAGRARADRVAGPHSPHAYAAKMAVVLKMRPVLPEGRIFLRRGTKKDSKTNV